MENDTIGIIVAGIFSVASLTFSIITFFQNRKFSTKLHRAEFYQNLVDGFYEHNWKFIENWNNKGIRPFLNNTEDIEKDEVRFGQRVILFDHLYILWKIFVHMSILNAYELDSYRTWANK